MRELSSYECDQAGGGTIERDRDGTITASEGTATFGDNGSMTYRTNDGWTFEGNDEYWSITNDKGEMVDCAAMHWLKCEDRPNA